MKIDAKQAFQNVLNSEHYHENAKVKYWDSIREDLEEKIIKQSNLGKVFHETSIKKEFSDYVMEQLRKNGFQVGEKGPYVSSRSEEFVRITIGWQNEK